jgi:hypothetical protein
MAFLTLAAADAARAILIAMFAVASFVPAWILAGRILEPTIRSRFRALCAAGFALVGYLSVVNLAGRLTNNSFVGVAFWFLASAVLTVRFWRSTIAMQRARGILRASRGWAGLLAVAIVLGIPQWSVAVATNFFDEAASSAIHLTAPNQFAEGVFPPRHNALPDIPIKYHYGFTILSGTVRLLTGLSANVSIDVVSTALWLFVFLFVYCWLRTLFFRRTAALWASVATLLGGGLAWLYLGRIETYSGIEKVPAASAMTHRFEPAKNWLENLLIDGRVPSQHLRNVDGTLSNLPWDIAAQFQQHAVALGIAMTLVALLLFVTWQKREGLQPWLLVANIVTVAVTFLGHSVFGAVTAVTFGICLLASWLRRPTTWRFWRGAIFGVGVATVGLLHGGLLSRGPQYGLGAATTLRTTLGYFSGGLEGLISWNIAGFGLPLLLTLLAWALYAWRRDPRGTDRSTLFVVLTVFALVSYSIPQLMFYSSEGAAVEQFTEISKFFFCSHFAFALLSVFAIARLLEWVPWPAILPGFVAMSVTPLAFIYAGSFNQQHKWNGFYRSPYFLHSIEQQMGEALARLKRSPRDVYFDASADERKHGYLSELLIYGGSVFTLTPSRYERTGIGYRLSEAVVARRFVQNGRMARLLPGASDDCSCDWYYTRTMQDMAMSPLIVRARFAKAVAESYFVPRFHAGPRTLYSIDKSTTDLDFDLDKYWRPRVVQQLSRRAGAGKRPLIFFDLVNRRIVEGDTAIEPAPALLGELPELYTAYFDGDARPDFVAGRLKDTEFHLGRKIEDIIEASMFEWAHRDSRDTLWARDESSRWLWDWDMPLIADLGKGFDSQVAYRYRTGQWLLGQQVIAGPRVDSAEFPVPFAGRFFAGSRADLGLWSLGTGRVTLQRVDGGPSIQFAWGGRPGDVLVPGDYDGVGYDEIAVWQQTNHTWYWRRVPDGQISQATFGTETSVPIPADYDGDGKLDLAYWEPRAGKIFVSFSRGRTIDRMISVPAHSVPAFVNLY